MEDNQEHHAYDSSMSPERALDLTVREITMFPVQSGEQNCSISLNEIKLFLAINIIMTYIKYPIGVNMSIQAQLST
jgi:hypothetical protein